MWLAIQPINGWRNLLPHPLNGGWPCDLRWLTKLKRLCESSQPWPQGALQLLLLASWNFGPLCEEAQARLPEDEKPERGAGGRGSPDKSQTNTSHVSDTIIDQSASDEPLVTAAICRCDPERDQWRSHPSRKCWPAESWANKTTAVSSR